MKKHTKCNFIQNKYSTINSVILVRHKISTHTHTQQVSLSIVFLIENRANSNRICLAWRPKKSITDLSEPLLVCTDIVREARKMFSDNHLEPREYKNSHVMTTAAAQPFYSDLRTERI